VNFLSFEVWEDMGHIEVMPSEDITYLDVDGVKLDCVVGALEDELNVLIRTLLVVLDELVGISDCDIDVAATVELVVEATGQLWALITLESSVTEPPRPNIPPLTTAAVSNVTEIPARMFPWNMLPDPCAE
jgi:hypothetical protein